MMRLAIVGGGPAGFMIFNRLVESGRKDLQIDIFEASSRLGSGMPYSEAGALKEHVTNVSSDELPELSQMLDEYILGLPDDTLGEFGIERDKFHEKKVVPRLLFGRYLGAQFEKQRLKAVSRGISVELHLNVKVVDVKDLLETKEISVKTSEGDEFVFDHVTVCTGHQWEKLHEGAVAGYYDSPYPPGKIARRFNHKVVVRGSSLTAVDAIKTTAQNNGRFFWEKGRYVYERNADSPDFFIEMHSRDGLLPSVRVHMEEPHVNSSSLIPQAELDANMAANEGFLSLDFLFDRGFIQPLAESAPALYKHVSKMNIEQFVDEMMSYREKMPAFELLQKEYDQSLQSIEDEEAVPWKEMLGSLSFAMNYPAKHLSAEDMLRLRKRLLPLISVVIAFMPQSSCETLLALHNAGCLELIADGEGGSVEINHKGQIVYVTKNPDNESICPTFIDCIGQRHYNVDDFPFKSLVTDNTICGARLRFRDARAAKALIAEGNKDVVCEGGKYYLKVPGVSINDQFSAVDRLNRPHGRLSLMAVPHIGGFNPDFSGLDFCEQASKRIVQSLIA
jgi:hypothetical protein